MEDCLVFFDVDGTLLFRNNYISPRTIAQINRMRGTAFLSIPDDAGR